MGARASSARLKVRGAGRTLAEEEDHERREEHRAEDGRRSAHAARVQHQRRVRERRAVGIDKGGVGDRADLVEEAVDLAAEAVRIAPHAAPARRRRAQRVEGVPREILAKPVARCADAAVHRDAVDDSGALNVRVAARVARRAELDAHRARRPATEATDSIAEALCQRRRLDGGSRLDEVVGVELKERVLVVVRIAHRQRCDDRQREPRHRFTVQPRGRGNKGRKKVTALSACTNLVMPSFRKSKRSSDRGAWLGRPVRGGLCFARAAR